MPGRKRNSQVAEIVEDAVTMPGRKRNSQAADVENVNEFDFECDNFEGNFIDYVFIRNDNEDDSLESDSDLDEDYDTNEGSYELIYEKYNSTQKLLHEKHPYEWID